MTHHEQELLEHILAGRSIMTPSEDVVIFDTLSNDETGHEISIDELHNCEIYLTEDQKTIKNLQSKIESLESHMKTLSSQKKILGSNLREANGSGPKSTKKLIQYKHLQAKEVKEIEAIFRQNPNTSRVSICNSYGSSQPVISRIATGVHVKSSAEYKLYISKKQMDIQ